MAGEEAESTPVSHDTQEGRRQYVYPPASTDEVATDYDDEPRIVNDDTRFRDEVEAWVKEYWPQANLASWDRPRAAIRFYVDHPDEFQEQVAELQMMLERQSPGRADTGREPVALSVVPDPEPAAEDALNRMREEITRKTAPAHFQDVDRAANRTHLQGWSADHPCTEPICCRVAGTSAIPKHPGRG